MHQSEKIQLHVCENTAKQLHSSNNSTNNAVHVHRPVGSHVQLQLAAQPAAVPALSMCTYHLFINEATLKLTPA